MSNLAQLGPKWARPKKAKEKAGNKRQRKVLERKARQKQRKVNVVLFERERKQRRLHILRTQIVPRLEEILNEKQQRILKPKNGVKKRHHRMTHSKRDRRTTHREWKGKGDLLFYAFQGGGFETNRRRH